MIKILLARKQHQQFRKQPMQADLKPTIPDFTTQIKYGGWS